MYGAIGGVGGTALTIGVDSYYWSSWTWPEAHGVWFNVYRNESAKWGTSPWHYYLKHLPLLLLAAAPLGLMSGAVRAARRRVDWTVGVLPAAVMVAALSALGHKEWRFVAYVVPWLNVPAAVMAAHLCVCPSAALPLDLFGTDSCASVPTAGNLVHSRPPSSFACCCARSSSGRSLPTRSPPPASCGSQAATIPGARLCAERCARSCCGSTASQVRPLNFSPPSTTGWPADALAARPPSVHLCSPSLPLQTGSTLFLASSPIDGPRAVFNKTELAVPLTPELARRQSQWTHVILPSGTDDEVAAWLAPPEAGETGWVEVARASGFGGFDIRRGPPAAHSDKAVAGPRPWVALGSEDGVGAGWGSVGATVRVREGERCVLVRRADWPRRSG